MKTRHESRPTLFQYAQIAASFVAAKTLSVLVRHPAHVVQAKKQANPSVPIKDIVKRIYNDRGVRGFYKSTSASIMKILVAECYRGPLMIEVPAYVRRNFLADTSFVDSKWVSNFIAVPIVTTIDATLICPILRMSTHQLTSDDPRITLKQISQHYLQTNPFKQFYRGYNMVWFQTAKSWATFFFIYDINKYLIKKYSGDVSYTALAIASLGVGVVQSTINHIPDTLRVHMQKSDHSGKNTKEVLSELVRTKGAKSLLAGISARLFGASISYGYKSMLLHYWETKTSHPSAPIKP